MGDIKFYWSGDREKRRQYAIEHTQEMEERYQAMIYGSSQNTKIYDNNTPISMNKKVDRTSIILVNLDSVSAIMQSSALGKKAILNFASYKNPGGNFIDGSRAQEECLCASSFLYNVLKRQTDYYEWNKKHLNRSLYLNRALYSPNIYFKHLHDEAICDVITCAAPNITPSRKYNWNVSDEENSKILDSRIKFVLDVAADNEVDVLILGAFGCGVFGQDAYEVISIFKKYLETTHKVFKQVIFAIPDNIHGENYIKAQKAVKGV